MSLNYSRGEIDGKKLLFSVSVLIPLTSFKTIDETIESVVRQGCSKCEILILRNDIQSLPQGTDVAEKDVCYHILVLNPAIHQASLPYIPLMQ